MRYKIIQVSTESKIFITGIFISLLITYLCFASFTKVSTRNIVNNIYTSDSRVIYSVDKCVFTEGYVAVDGWITNKDGASKISVFLVNGNEMIKLNTTPQFRPDVSHAFSAENKYDLSGFSSSLRIRTKNLLSRTIVFKVVNADAEIWVKHEC